MTLGKNKSNEFCNDCLGNYCYSSKNVYPNLRSVT